MPRHLPFELHFWSHVEITPDCWMWHGNIDTNGYGRTTFNGVRTGAHRVSYFLLKGEIPKGMMACHHCDNPKCVNPAHIFIGTQKDNMQDWTKKGLNKAVAEGRFAQRGKDHWKHTAKGRAYVRQWANRISRELRSGKRTVIRDSKGRIMGTRVL